MDQLKVYLKLAAKYRFWIAFGISLLLPVIGFVVGAGAIDAETTKREAEIKGAKSEIGKYKTPGLVNNQYQPLASTKKDALVTEVDSTWRKLFASQEPLLKWPTVVEERFRKWGRKYPTNIDKRQINSTIIDYTVAYPEFVQRIYTIFKPFNFDDGTGIVVAPEPAALLAPAPFTQNNPPDLTQIWAEQERLWVMTALLDAIAKINDSVGAKDWDGAIVKQLNIVDVGAATDQDQKSMAKGDTLIAADSIADPSAPATAAPAAPSGPGIPGGGPGIPGGMGGMAMGGSMEMGGGASGKAREVMYLDTKSQQFKALPIMMSVLVDQARLADFLVGLENSPMAIEVNEVEIVKPLTPVTKPVYGERSSFNFGPMAGGGRTEGDMMASMMGGRGRAGQPGPMGGAGMPGGSIGARMGNFPGMGEGPGMGGFGGAPKATGGVDIRSKNEAKARKDKAKKEQEAAAKAKGETKKIDQYYNVIEAKVYGRARFYLAPPPPPTPPPSTAAAPETPAPAPTPTPEPAKAETPKAEAAPVGATPAPGDATKGEAPAPKTEGAPAGPAPAEATKGADSPKPEPGPTKDATPKADPNTPATKP